MPILLSGPLADLGALITPLLLEHVTSKKHPSEYFIIPSQSRRRSMFTAGCASPKGEASSFDKGMYSAIANLALQELTVANDAGTLYDQGVSERFMPRAPFLEGFLQLFKYGNMEIEESVVTFIDKSPRLTLFAGVVSENTCLAASSIRLLLLNTMRFGHRSFSLRKRGWLH